MTINNDNTVIDSVMQSLSHLSPTQVCQAYYIAAVTAIVTITTLIPSSLRNTIVLYGPRQTAGDDTLKRQNGVLIQLLRLLEVPHSWFLHFYVLSVGLSLFWAWQYATHGAVMRWIAETQVQNGGEQESVEITRVFVGWGLMMAQGGRRLYESLAVMRAGKSPMSSIHWLVGVSFYAVMSVSVWVDGSGAILDSWESIKVPSRVPSMMISAISIFLIGWMKQFECHKHLASLKKYTLPDKGWFKNIVCPHYTSECLIYLGISMVTAPPGQLLNRTVLLGLVFVFGNLGTTASNTKDWYIQKFGTEKVAPKWKMIPFVF